MPRAPGRWCRRGAVELEAAPLLPVHLMVGTGYGLEPEWKHGMYQGPELVVQGVTYNTGDPRMWGLVDAVGRFEYDGHVGYGLYEYAARLRSHRAQVPARGQGC